MHIITQKKQKLKCQPGKKLETDFETVFIRTWIRETTETCWANMWAIILAFLKQG